MARVHLLSTFGAVFAGLIGLGLGVAQASPELDACLAGCKRANLSATNRASCRLDCETEAATDPEQVRAQMARQAPARPASPAAPPDARAAKVPGSCKAGCDADRSLSVDDRASCKLDCEQEALPVPGGVVTPSAPPASKTAPIGAPLLSPAAPPVTSQAGFLARCQATCRSGPSPRQIADFETCKLDCETMASVLDVARGLVPDAWLAAPPAPAAAPVLTGGPIAARVAPPPSPPVLTTPSPAVQGCGPALERCNAGCSKQEGACGRSCGRARGSETDRETCKLTCGTDREVCQGDCLSARATCENNQARR